MKEHKAMNEIVQQYGLSYTNWFLEEGIAGSPLGLWLHKCELVEAVYGCETGKFFAGDAGCVGVMGFSLIISAESFLLF